MIFLTGGCSFSYTGDTVTTWNSFLENKLSSKHSFLHTGYDAQGHDLISRKLMYRASHAMKTNPEEKIVVIAMWSGHSRKAFLSSNNNDYITSNMLIEEGNKKLASIPNYETLVEKFNINMSTTQNILLDDSVSPAGTPGYIYWTPGHQVPRVEEFYQKFTNQYDDWDRHTFSMLALQNFCKANNIEYFWCNYTDEWKNFYNSSLKESGILDWMYTQLDFSRCITHEGMANWCKNRLFKSKHNWHAGDNSHPSELAHRHFTYEVLMPFLDKFIEL